MSYLEDEDVQLMLRFQTGEESCFEELVKRHKKIVFNLSYRFMANYQDAEDLAQEIFIKVYHSKNNYTPKAKFTTWLYAISRNTCLKKLRKVKPKMISIDENIEFKENTGTRQIADSKAYSPLELSLKEEENSVVKQALDLLPPNQKMAVILCRYDGLSYEDIAKIMSTSVKAVKSLIHRAKISLKEKLKTYCKN